MKYNNITWMLITLAGILTAYNMMTGSFQKYIAFQGILNEILFTFVFIMIAIIGLIMIDYNKIIRSLHNIFN